MKQRILTYSIILSLFLGFHFSTYGQYFATSYGSATSAEHRVFMNSQRIEVNKRAALWKVPSTIVNLVASVQSNAGRDVSFNYGKIKSMSHLTKYPKFSQVATNGLVRCEKASRGIEAIAITLNELRKHHKGLYSEKAWLELLFVQGSLKNRIEEARKAYLAYGNSSFPINHTNKPNNNLVTKINSNQITQRSSIRKKEPTTKPNNSHTDELIQLKNLYNQKLITEEEYSKNKQDILNQLLNISNTQAVNNNLQVSSNNNYCDFIPSAKKQIKEEIIEYSDRVTNADARIASKVMKEILDASGNSAVFRLKVSKDVPNARAQKEPKTNERVIIYNPNFFKNIKNQSNKWAIYGLFAHEIGHHINFHLDNHNDRHSEEIEADMFSGFILNKLGANIDEAKLCMEIFGNEENSSTHPAKANRLKAIEDGWHSAQEKNSYKKLVKLADKDYDEGNLDEAKRKYERAVAARPTDKYAKSQLYSVKKEIRKKKAGKFFKNLGSSVTKTMVKALETAKAKQDSTLSDSNLSNSSSYNSFNPNKAYVEKQDRREVYYSIYGNRNCPEANINVTIKIGDETFTPIGNSLKIPNIKTGLNSYEISGKIKCSTGSCNVKGKGNININEWKPKVYLRWQIDSYGSCVVSLTNS